MFNKDMLILAREFNGYTQKELSAKLDGVSQGHLSKLELGIHDIKDEILQQLIKVLDLPKDFFYQQKKHYGLPLSINGNFRKKQSLTKKANSKIISLINIVLHNIENLLDLYPRKTSLLEIAGKYKNNDSCVIAKNLNKEDKKCINTIITEVKKIFKIPNDKPINNIVSLLEENNIFIIDLDFGTNLVDGFSYWINDIPVIFVSKDSTGDRQRFTIAHELAHIILHKNYINERMEEEANYFASEFLMPSNAIKEDLKYISIDKLANLKLKWKVSMSALLMKAKELELASDYITKVLFIRMSKMGYRKTEPVSVEYEHTHLIKQLISQIEDKTATLCLNSNRIKDIYGIT